MSELITVARPYAKAAFEYAQRQKELAGWGTVLENLAVVAANDDAFAFLSNPTVKREDKVTFLLGFVDDSKDGLRTGLENFVRLMAEYGRLTILPEIARLYHAYRAEFEKSMEVTLTSAKPLDNQQEETLKQALSRRLNREINLNVQIDDSLLGGAIIQAGDFVIDGSVRGKLDKLSTQLAV